MCLPCPVCNQQTFDSCVAMLKRLIQVANDSLICPVCRETFIGLDKFTIHLFSHTDHKSEPDTEELTKISRTKIKCDARSPANRENGGIQCDTCGFYFENSSTLEMHTKLIHNSSKNNDKNGNSKYPCHLCSKSFKMRGSLMVHLRMVHFGIVPPLGKQEKLEAGIDNEEVGESIKDPPAAISESNVKQWSCDICKKSFTTKYFLKKHKRLHTGTVVY